METPTGEAVEMKDVGGRGKEPFFVGYTAKTYKVRYIVATQKNKDLTYLAQ